MTVMVVEDTAMMRRRLREVLVKELKVAEKNIYEMANGHEAVNQYKIVNPDYVLLDIFMPGIDGVETMRQLKAIDPDAYVVMVTSSSTRRVVIDSILAGARDYIKKPPTLQKIASALKIDLFNPQPKPRERAVVVADDAKEQKAVIDKIVKDQAFDEEDYGDVMKGLTIESGGDDFLNEALK